MHVLQGFILIAAAPVFGKRSAENLNIDLETSGLQGFKAWAADNCPDCDLIFGSLIEGVMKAGFLKESSCTWNQNTLQAKLDSDVLYGEIASASRVPVMWKLDQTLSFTFSKEGDKTFVTSNGIGTQPPKQSMDLYKNAMKEASLKGTDCIDDDSCIKAEIEAAGKYLKNSWKKIKKDDRKIRKVLMTMYDATSIYLTVKAKGQWPTIMYSLATPVPLTLTNFTFEDGHVYAGSTPDTKNSLYKDYNELHLDSKSSKMGLKSLMDAKHTLSIAVQMAKSGMNFAMMMAYGRDENYRSVLQKIDVHGAQPKAIANMFSFCEGSTPGQDPKCKGSTPGRVAWSSQIPVSMI